MGNAGQKCKQMQAKTKADAEIVTRSKFIFACKNIYLDWTKHSNSIQLLLQCCPLALIANLPANSTYYSVKANSLGAFANFVAANMTLHAKVDYATVKHHLISSTPDADNFSAQSYYNRNSNIATHRTYNTYKTF